MVASLDGLIARKDGRFDEVRYSLVPIVIGDGIRFFEKLDRDVALHPTEVKAYKRGMMALGYCLRRGRR